MLDQQMFPGDKPAFAAMGALILEGEQLMLLKENAQNDICKNIIKEISEYLK